MTEEEKDILQDRVLRYEATASEVELHEALMASDETYRLDYEIKEGLVYVNAMEFVSEALETPIFRMEEMEPEFVEEPAWSRSPAEYQISEPARTRTERSEARPDWWALAASLLVAVASSLSSSMAIRWAVAASLLVAVVSTIFLADFRSAEQFVAAELSAHPALPEQWYAYAQTTRGTDIDWHRAYKEGEYQLVVDGLQWASVATEDTLLRALEKNRIEIETQDSIRVISDGVAGDGSNYRELLSMGARLEAELLSLQEADTELPMLRYALGLSKLHLDVEGQTDFGQDEFGWLVEQERYPDGVGPEVVTWQYALALYASGDCKEAFRKLEQVGSKKARKLRRKMRSDCQLD